MLVELSYSLDRAPIKPSYSHHTADINNLWSFHKPFKRCRFQRACIKLSFSPHRSFMELFKNVLRKLAPRNSSGTWIFIIDWGICSPLFLWRLAHFDYLGDLLRTVPWETWFTHLFWTIASHNSLADLVPQFLCLAPLHYLGDFLRTVPGETCLCSLCCSQFNGRLDSPSCLGRLCAHTYLAN